MDSPPRSERRFLTGFPASGVKSAVGIVGVAGVISVVVNAVIYRNFANTNLHDFESPLDEDQEVLAKFAVDKDVDEGGFFFGLATAPAHVEDKLNDAWLEFAQETAPSKPQPPIKYPPYGCVGEEFTEDEGATSSAGVEAIKEEGGKEGEGGGEGGLGESGVLVKSVDLSEGEKNGKEAGEWQVVEQNKGGSAGGQGEEKPVVKAKQKGGKKSTRDPVLQFTNGFNMADRIDPASNARRLLRKVSGKVHDAKQWKEKKKGGVQEEEAEDYSPNVAAFHNVPNPETRLKFWTEPETELQLAAGTGSSVFRLGVDWGRIVTQEPVDGMPAVVDWDAVKHYRWILERVRSHNMEIMLSLFHHSLPKWASPYGGWKEEKTITYFVEFARLCAQEFGDLVKWWISFNEPHVFAMLTYCVGAWPGASPDLMEQVSSALPRGVFEVVMKAMAAAHNQSFDVLHEEAGKKGRKTKVGVSHHVSYQRPYGLFDTPLVAISTMLTRFAFVDDVCDKCDFIGVNYYGQEFVSGPGLKLVHNVEFSDSGRGVYPDGLFRALVMFHQRYNTSKGRSVPFYITENGIADGTDLIRRPYILEHLLAVRAAMNLGVPVQGYLFWTTSDNWEWADGYGPKFGLVHVDRENNLKRTKRPSYHLYTQICKTGEVTAAMRDAEWKTLQDAAEAGKKRPFFRAVANGVMFAGGLDTPIDRPLIKRDWRFGHYETEGLQDPISKLVRLAITICTFGLLKRKGKKGGKKSEKDLKTISSGGHRVPSGAPSGDGKLDQDLVIALALER